MNSLLTYIKTCSEKYHIAKTVEYLKVYEKHNRNNNKKIRILSVTVNYFCETSLETIKKIFLYMFYFIL